MKYHFLIYKIMKYLKSYNKLFESEKSIHELCREYRITNYIINDGSIDVDGNVDLSGRGLTKLPLKFRNVSGGFYCHNNKLTSLEGCPSSVGGDFWCYNNELTSLEGSPISVGGSFYCYMNKLTSLEGSPISVGRDFYCYRNELTSLEGSPSSVGGHFWCDNNKLTSLEGCPRSVGGGFSCLSNPCYPIYREWIENREIRKELLYMIEDYDFLRGSTIIWNRLESFFDDNDLKIPSKEELSKNYKII
jgi:hypothetical protein